MFFGLRHGTVGAGDDEDSAVHLGCAGDHVLDVISVPGAVHVGVVAVRGLVLNGGSVDGDTAGAFLWGGVDFVVFLWGGATHGGEGHGEGGGQGGLAVVDMSDGADIDMGFLPLEFSSGGANCERAAAAAGSGSGCLK